MALLFYIINFFMPVIKFYKLGVLKISKLPKKYLWPIIIIIMISALFAYNLFRGERSQLFTVATGSPGGVYYPLGGAMAEVISRNLEGVRCDSESTGGSVENVRLVGNAESDMGMVTENAAYKGSRGEYPYSRTYPIKVMFNMYPAPLHIVTVEGSGIDTIEDLAGKRVSIDAPGSGTEDMSRTVLEELGLLDQVRTINYAQQDAAAALRDGNVDAVFWNFAYPASVVMEVSATHDIKFIPLEEEHLERITDKNPYFVSDIIPSGVYDNEKDIPVLSVNNLLIAREDMEEELVYDLLRIIFDNLDRLIEVHDIAERIKKEDAVKTSVDLHPGAIRFFQEELDEDLN